MPYLVLTVNIGNGGTFTPTSTLLGLLTNTTINFNGTGTFVADAASTTLNLISSLTINGYSPSSGRTIEFEHLATAPQSYVIGALSGGTQTISIYSGTGGTGTLLATFSVAETASTAFTAATCNTATAGQLTIAYDGSSITTVTSTPKAACFLSGSMIRTDRGDVAVEDMRIGDQVFAYADGRAELRSIIWVGRKSEQVIPGVPVDEAGYPVRVLRDAIADGVPYKDMLVTDEHCLYFDGKFVPVRMLINQMSIFYDTSITRYEYYHVETAEHSIIRADCVLTESYLDTGNRLTFHQPGTVVCFDRGAEKSWAVDGAAPLGVARALVEPIFRSIESRALAADLPMRRAAPLVTEDADLHLVTNAGKTIRMMKQVGDRALFIIPGEVESVRIMSRTEKPFRSIGAFVDDRRSLGVLVGEITFSEVGQTRVIDGHLAQTRLSGWFDQDHAQLRWTQGDALLELGDHAGRMGVLSLQIVETGLYILHDQDAAAAVA